MKLLENPPVVRLPRLHIENCEAYSEWLLLEYRHCIASWKGVVFTNVTDQKLTKALSGKAQVYKKSLARLPGFDPERTIVADPLAKSPLSAEDMEECDALVIGGILGSEGFTGKTGTLLTKKWDCQSRHLGKIQLSIDSAVVVSRLIALGMKLGDIMLSSELEIDHGDGGTTVLPYGYPVLDNKVIFTPGLREYLRKH